MCHRLTYHQDSGRLPISLPELWLWVDYEVAEQVNAQKVFTAYSITKLLRAGHPEHEIVHYDVNMRVHTIMEIVDHYGMTWQTWNGSPARTYTPIIVDLKAASLPVAPIAVAVESLDPVGLSVPVLITWEAKDD